MRSQSSAGTSLESSHIFNSSVVSSSKSFSPLKKYYNIGYLYLYMHGYGNIERDKDSECELPREELAS